jgi:hypothetical protein
MGDPAAKFMRAGGAANGGIRRERTTGPPPGLITPGDMGWDLKGGFPADHPLRDGRAAALPLGKRTDVRIKVTMAPHPDGAEKMIAQGDHVWVWRTEFDVALQSGTRASVFSLSLLNTRLRQAKMNAMRADQERHLRKRGSELARRESTLAGMPLTPEEFSATMQYLGVVRAKMGSIPQNEYGGSRVTMPNAVGDEDEALSVTIRHEETVVNLWGKMIAGDTVGFRVVMVDLDHPERGEGIYQCLQVLPAHENSGVFQQCTGPGGVPQTYIQDTEDQPTLNYLCGDTDYIERGHRVRATRYAVDALGRVDMERPIHDDSVVIVRDRYVNGFFLPIGKVWDIPPRFLSRAEMIAASTTAEGAASARLRNCRVRLHLSANSAPTPCVPPPRGVIIQ